YDFKFVIEQPIFTWGKINNAVHLYETISETKKFNIQKSKSEIRTKINIYSHTLFYLHKMEECLAQQQEHAHRLVTIAEESFQNGFILSADLLNAKISAKKIDVAVAELNEQKAQVFLELQHLSGLKKIDYDDFDFSFVKPIDAIEVSSQENYYKKAVEINPGLQMLTCLKDINELQVKIKKGYGYFKPDIGIHLELGYAGSRFPFIEKDWYGEDGIVFTSSLAFKSTLFDGGKVRNDINKSQEELNKALFQYQDGLNNLDQFISESILKLELNKRNIEYYRLKQENDKEQITLRKTQFDAGAGAEKDYLQEKINLNTDLINEYKETIDFYKNYFSLESVARAEE
ncbi:MAG: TolC family protein, partial [Spirochaetales bacterium]|nr:TolC family protein [Spirochaetales bacterium]